MKCLLCGRKASVLIPPIIVPFLAALCGRCAAPFESFFNNIEAGPRRRKRAPRSPHPGRVAGAPAGRRRGRK